MAAELKAVEKGSLRAVVGRSPSFSELKKRMHHRELNQAVQLGKDIFTLSGFHVDPDSSHRPPTEKKQNKKRGAKKRLRKIQINNKQKCLIVNLNSQMIGEIAKVISWARISNTHTHRAKFGNTR